MEELKTIISGKVKWAGTQKNDNKEVVTIFPDYDSLEKIKNAIPTDKVYYAEPIKTTDEGVAYIKAQSSFGVKVYEHAVVTDDIKIDDIGEGSDVSLFIKLKESKYKGKTSVVAYLLSVNVMELEEKEEFNPFNK